MTTETVQQGVVSEVGNPHLRKVHVHEPLVIDALEGKRRICDAHDDVFAAISGFDPTEKHIPIPTQLTHVELHLVNTKNLTFRDIFQKELQNRLESAFTEDQVVELADKYKHLLSQRGCIFALCFGSGAYYIVSIFNSSKGLKIAKLPINNTNEWDSHKFDYGVVKKVL